MPEDTLLPALEGIAHLLVPYILINMDEVSTMLKERREIFGGHFLPKLGPGQTASFL